MTARPTARPIAMPLARHVTGAGEGGGAVTPLLLDTYTGAAVAYSLRLLRTSYSGSCVRVRRSSDNAEQNIGFSSGAIDTASLLSFCGAGNGFVTTWYDQSGNANNLTQAMTTQQPQIVNAGAVILENSLPSMYIDNDTFTTGSNISATAWSCFVVSRRVSGVMTHFDNTAGRPYSYANWSDTYVYMTNSTHLKAAENLATTIRELTTSHNQPTADMVIRRNGVNLSLGAKSSLASASAFNTLVRAAGVGYMQEAVLWNTSQVDNQLAIESNINSYWGVY